MDQRIDIPLVCYHYVHKNKGDLETDKLIKLITFPEEIVTGKEYIEENYEVKEKYQFENLRNDMDPKDFFKNLSNLCKLVKISELENNLQSHLSIGDIVEVNNTKGLFTRFKFIAME